MAIRAHYLHKTSGDLSNYKLNIMSEDIGVSRREMA